MLPGVCDSDGAADLRVVAEKDADLHLVIETLARSEIRCVLVGGLALSVGAANVATADTDRGRTAVIADRDMLVVGKERRRRSKEATGIGRVLDRCIEIDE